MYKHVSHGSWAVWKEMESWGSMLDQAAHLMNVFVKMKTMMAVYTMFECGQLHVRSTGNCAFLVSSSAIATECMLGLRKTCHSIRWPGWKVAGLFLGCPISNPDMGSCCLDQIYVQGHASWRASLPLGNDHTNRLNNYHTVRWLIVSFYICFHITKEICPCPLEALLYLVHVLLLSAGKWSMESALSGTAPWLSV